VKLCDIVVIATNEKKHYVSSIGSFNYSDRLNFDYPSRN